MAVTLITGDTVLWQDSGDGNPRVAEIEQAPREQPVTFDQSGTQEDFYVIPTDVMEHVVAGTVDMELFNIPGLIRQGLDDAATDKLPVIGPELDLGLDEARKLTGRWRSRLADRAPVRGLAAGSTGSGFEEAAGGDDMFRELVLAWDHPVGKRTDAWICRG